MPRGIDKTGMAGIGRTRRFDHAPRMAGIGRNSVAQKIAALDAPGLRMPASAYSSTCSEMARALSTSIPTQRTVLSSLLPAGNMLDYLPRRTMSRRAVTRFIINVNG
jgi:hypothetical protein